MTQKLILVALAGAVGTLCRYGLGNLVHRWLGAGFPWGTVCVNLVGSFAFGLVWALAVQRAVIGPEARLIILTGFMGAFTTFSTFMFETGELLRGGQWLFAMGNLALQNIIGLLAVLAGMALARAL